MDARYWRYWHRKEYWVQWMPIPEDGLLEPPRNALIIQISETEREDFPPGYVED